MSLRNRRLLAALAALMLFAVLFLVPSAASVGERKAILVSQFSMNVTHIGVRLAVAAVILAATFFLGRFYCSFVCPAGLTQELFHRLGGVLGLRRLRYAVRGRPLWVLAAVGLAAILGMAAVANFLDPIGLFGRLAMLSARPGPLAAGVVVLLAAGAVLLVAAALFKGRWFCDRLCPVGALLGLVSDAGRRGMELDRKKCVSCGRCEKVCPVRAIDAAGKRLESGRCVLCFDCLAECPAGAIAYRAKKQPERRTFLRSAATAAIGGFFVFSRPLASRLGFAGAKTPDLVPPGADSFARHRERCVSCQACVASCPVGIIRLNGTDLRPTLDFDRGYCQYNCVACSESCPAGALTPVPLGEKQQTRIALTSLELDRCVAVSKNEACGACAEVCPTHAVRMEERGEGLPTAPDFDGMYCIGCGACYHVCPTEPRSFTIRGIARHETAAGIRPGGHFGEPDENAAQPASDDWAPADFPF